MMYVSQEIAGGYYCGDEEASASNMKYAQRKSRFLRLHLAVSFYCLRISEELILVGDSPYIQKLHFLRHVRSRSASGAIVTFKSLKWERAAPCRDWSSCLRFSPE